MTCKYLLVSCLMILLFFQELTAFTQYHYRYYPYRKKQKNERKIRQLSHQCDSSDECRHLFGLDKLRCTRMCMSGECYQELYGHDELEEGEIDIRANSFKGCFLDKRKP